MKILALTNTYSPHVGGVARSVASFAEEYRRQGHRVLIVAPHFEDQPDEEEDVVRVPALSDFHGSGFSLALPIPGLLSERLRVFDPDIVHSHHPYLLGMTALRVARFRDLPLVFTHHTLYEEYTHYIGAEGPRFRRFIAELATSYANLCDRVFAPSESVATLLQERGVTTPVSVVPTGTETSLFNRGRGDEFRRAHGIPPDAFVVGHIGRLAPEKNPEFLVEAVIEFMHTDERAHFLVAGDGPSGDAMQSALSAAGLGQRIHFPGVLHLPRLADAYRAMDVFAFTSKSETQGMVLVEAMAAGVPVVGLDAPGVREVVRDAKLEPTGGNGRLLADASQSAFAAALAWMRRQPDERALAMRRNALDTADAFSLPRTAALALDHYDQLRRRARGAPDQTRWHHLAARVQAEWQMIRGMAEAARYGRKARSRQLELEK